MQALLAPLLGAGTAATTAATALQAGMSIFSGVQAFSKAQSEREKAEINAHIGQTRAIQTDASIRSGMEEELGSMRAVFAANQQKPNVGTAEVFSQLRSTRGRERRVEFRNRMQEASDWKMEGRAASGRATAGLLGGFVNAGPSIYDLYQLRRS
jgi:hypothetical protein